MQYKTIFEPFKIKTVEPIRVTSEEERKQRLADAFFNVFLLRSEDVLIDLLTDSGTSAMSAAQWSAMMSGDESYAGARSWTNLEKEVHDLTGFQYILPTHQGRAAEHILYGYLGGKGKIFISNTHFDTTRANVEVTGASAIDIPAVESLDISSEFPFKGNIHIDKLRSFAKSNSQNIAAVILTVTNNSGGGQPVSMQNAREVSKICKEYKLLFIIDCCRIAENSYFIRHHEKEYKDKSYREIAQEMSNLQTAA